MTAMMGLDARLRLAKVAVLVPALDAGEQLANLADEMAAACAAMLLIDDRRVDLAKLSAAYQVARDNAGFDALVGVASNDDSLAKLGCDVQLSNQPVARSHPWSLRGLAVTDEASLRAALVEPEIEFCFVPRGLVEMAAYLAPVTDPASKPWFAMGMANTDDTRLAVQRGAARVALWVNRLGLGGTVEKHWQIVNERWRAPEMQQAAFAAFAEDYGQQRRPDQEPPAWPMSADEIWGN